MQMSDNAHVFVFLYLQKSWRSQSQQQPDDANGQRAQPAPVQLRANYSRGRNGQVQQFISNYLLTLLVYLESRYYQLIAI